MTIQRRTFTPGLLSFRELSDKSQPSCLIEGYAIRFDQRSAPIPLGDGDVAYELISPNAVSRALLERSDVKFTLFGDRQLLLGRSRNGRGTLCCSIDSQGLKFSCTLPATADGRKARELVKRGDLAGCGISFLTDYEDRSCVNIERKTENGHTVMLCRVKRIETLCGVSLEPAPAFDGASPSLQELRSVIQDVAGRSYIEQVREMRSAVPGLFR